MNSPTIIDELKTQLKNARLEIAHLNAVNQELYDELTEAKNAVKSFSMELQAALVTLAKYDDGEDLLVVLSDSAKDLLHRECI